MKRTSVFLPEELLKAVQKRSEKTGAPVAEIVRRALREYLKRAK